MPNASLTRRRSRFDASNDDPMVQCWCREGFVVATWGEVREGRTRPCGRRGCEAPE